MIPLSWAGFLLVPLYGLFAFFVVIFLFELRDWLSGGGKRRFWNRYGLNYMGG